MRLTTLKGLIIKYSTTYLLDYFTGYLTTYLTTDLTTYLTTDLTTYLTTDLTTDLTTYLTTYLLNMAHTLDQILTRFEPLEKVVFEPIQVEPQRAVQPLLLLTFITASYPFDYFALFFTYDLLQLITKYTNQYTAILW